MSQHQKVPLAPAAPPAAPTAAPAAAAHLAAALFLSTLLTPPPKPSIGQRARRPDQQHQRRGPHPPADRGAGGEGGAGGDGSQHVTASKPAAMTLASR